MYNSVIILHEALDLTQATIQLAFCCFRFYVFGYFASSVYMFGTFRSQTPPSDCDRARL